MAVAGCYQTLLHIVARGYVSDKICDDEGLFSQNPILTVSFTRVHEKVIPGITIVWGRVYDDYADSFKVTVYNGETVVNSITVEGIPKLSLKSWRTL